jgi:hypothetical protein
MKLPLLVLVGIFIWTAVQAEEELEGRQGLIFRCKQTPENTEALCTCFADRAVAELPRETRAQLYVEWGDDTSFNFKRPMTPNDLPEASEKMWGQWQRKTVTACNAGPK